MQYLNVFLHVNLFSALCREGYYVKTCGKFNWIALLRIIDCRYRPQGRSASKKIFTIMTLNSSSTSTFITTMKGVSNLNHVACLQKNGNQQLAYVCVICFLILPFFFPKSDTYNKNSSEETRQAPTVHR